LLQLSLPCFSTAKCSKHCSLYRKFWGIVILFTKFIRACGSVFGIFLPCNIEAFKKLFSLEETSQTVTKNCFHRT